MPNAQSPSQGEETIRRARTYFIAYLAVIAFAALVTVARAQTTTMADVCPGIPGEQTEEQLELAMIEQAFCLHGFPQISLEQYRERIHNQYGWTNRALRNRCRPVLTLSEFTKTPLRAVNFWWRDTHLFYVHRRHERAQARPSLCLPTSTTGIIRYVFGAYGDQAVAVASCETGGTFNVYATNGQYWGLFQMGEYARARYGHSWTALGQSRAAYAYFRDSGSDWSPWACQPYRQGIEDNR